MRIILKYILMNILERRLRTVLILSVIMISSAMFFASISISGTLVNMQMDTYRQNYGYTDIIIRSGENSPSRWFYRSRAEKFRNDMEYIIGEMNGYGSFITSKAGQGAQNGRSDIAAQDARNEQSAKAVQTGKAGTTLFAGLRQICG